MYIYINIHNKISIISHKGFYIWWTSVWFSLLTHAIACSYQSTLQQESHTIDLLSIQIDNYETGYAYYRPKK